MNDDRLQRRRAREGRKCVLVRVEREPVGNHSFRLDASRPEVSEGPSEAVDLGKGALDRQLPAEDLVRPPAHSSILIRHAINEDRAAVPN